VATVVFDKPGLVLLGESVESVRIGEDNVDDSYHAIAGLGIASATIGNVTVNGGSYGIIWDEGGVVVVDTGFENCLYGMVIARSHGCEVLRCSFVSMDKGVRVTQASTDITIRDCTFDGIDDNAISMQTVTNALVADCRFTDVVSGVLYDYCQGAISGCEIYGRAGHYYGSAISVFASPDIAINDCVLDYTMNSTYTVLRVSNGASITGSGNVIRGDGQTSVYFSGEDTCHDFVNNEIYRARHYCLIALAYGENTDDPPLHLDMSGNYWGTEDEALIAEWIDDHLDHPDHPNYRMVVDFVPYHGDPVRVEPRSLSQVRGIFD
jgi:hypothetical protein